MVPAEAPMQPITRAEILEFAPSAREDYVEALVSGWPWLVKAGLATPLRWSHFIAQAAHETGGFRIVREDTSWTAEQMCRLWPARFKTRLDPRILACQGDPRKLAILAYGTMKTLGNTEPEDGWLYRGGSFPQLTGRAAYREIGGDIRIDLEGDPELIEDPRIGLQAYVAYWQRRQLSRYADRNRLTSVGNGINRGNPFAALPPIGADSRRQWFDRAWFQWGGGVLPNPHDLALGDRGARVVELQVRLHTLNYPCGACDGVFGAETARAIAAFKLDWRRETGEALEGDDVVGDATLSALERASPVQRGAGESMTLGEMAAKGSETAGAVVSGQKAAAGLAVVTAGTAGSQEDGVLDLARQQVDYLGSWREVADTGLSIVKWGFGNLGWVLMIAFGVWTWVQLRKVGWSRIRDHLQRRNLGR